MYSALNSTTSRAAPSDTIVRLITWALHTGGCTNTEGGGGAQTQRGVCINTEGGGGCAPTQRGGGGGVCINTEGGGCAPTQRGGGVQRHRGGCTNTEGRGVCAPTQRGGCAPTQRGEGMCTDTEGGGVVHRQRDVPTQREVGYGGGGDRITLHNNSS